MPASPLDTSSCYSATYVARHAACASRLQHLLCSSDGIRVCWSGHVRRLGRETACWSTSERAEHDHHRAAPRPSCVRHPATAGLSWSHSPSGLPVVPSVLINEVQRLCCGWAYLGLTEMQSIQHAACCYICGCRALALLTGPTSNPPSTCRTGACQD